MSFSKVRSELLELRTVSRWSRCAIAVCCALTDETRGLVNRDLLGRMRPHAVLVNVSRGAVIDTSAIIDALRSNKIGGAALDVFDVQPLPPDDALFDCPNLLLTPHTAGITRQSRHNIARIAAEQMLDILDGKKPPRLLNPAVWGAYSDRFARILGFRPEA